MLGNVWMLGLCLCVSWAEAHIWAWMLNMPHSPPKEGAKALRDSAPVAKATTVRVYWIMMLLLKYFKEKNCCSVFMCQNISS